MSLGFSPRTLFWDIETSPNLGDVWDIHNTNVSLSQLRESSRMICFAAKWGHEKQTMFFSEFQDGREAMLAEAHRLLDSADVVIDYNGKKFDQRMANGEFARLGWAPPAPYDRVDLYRVVVKNFRFPSNKLEYVVQELGVGRKVKHEGHSLWVKCMAGDEEAWKRMERYCKRDTALLPKLHARLLPWISGGPNHRLFIPGEHVCPNCGHDKLIRQGVRRTPGGLGAYPRFQCKRCFSWSQGSRREDGTQIRGISA